MKILWSRKREAIIHIGKELIRNLIPISKSNLEEINFIIEEIAKTSNSNSSQLVNNDMNVNIYETILHSPSHFAGLNPYVHVNIPPLLEKMLTFILTNVKRTHYSRYMSWLIKKFEISCDVDSGILIDVTRYLITCSSHFQKKPGEKFDKIEVTPRWLVIGYILKLCKNEILSAELKQAIYYDWLFYSKERDQFSLLEAGISVLFNSIKDFPQLTMELIEFLFTYSENFDPLNKAQIKNSVAEAFQQAEVYGMISLKKILCEDQILPEIKKIYSTLIERGNIFNCNNAALKTQQSQKNQDTSNHSTTNLKIDLKSDSCQSSNQTKVIRTVEFEFYIHPILDELISPITLKNFLNYKNKKIFKVLLEEICQNYVNKYKTNNFFESRINKATNHEIISNIANFYLNIFKDEIVGNFKSFINSIAEEEKSEEKNQIKCDVGLYLICFIISKFFDKNEKEFLMLSQVIRDILEKEPEFIISVFLYFTYRYVHPSKSKLLNSKNLYTIFSKIFEFNKIVLKDKINQFFELCSQNLDFYFINYFLEKGIVIFQDVFCNDIEFILKIVNFSRNIDLLGIKIKNKELLLITENSILYKLLSESINLSTIEQEKLWNLIHSHSNLNKITNFKEFLRSLIAITKNVYIKNKSNLSAANSIFLNLNKSLKTIFTSDINENNIKDLISLFEFPCQYADNIYSFLNAINSKLKSIPVMSNFPAIFSFLLEEYIKLVEISGEKYYSYDNLLRLLRELIIVEKNGGFLFDDFYSIAAVKNKYGAIAKSMRIELDL